MRGARLGSTIGAVGGLLFVVLNAGDLPAAVVLRIVAAALFVVIVVRALRIPDGGTTPEPAALRTYWICVIGEVVAIFVGAAVLNAVGHGDLVLPWVVLVLGVHFLPFARAFRAPVFTGLGLAEIAVGVVGAIATIAGADHAADWTGVVAGFVLLAFSLAGVLRPNGTAAQTR